MPRPRKPPRLWLRPARDGHNAQWIIRDCTRTLGTGAGPADLGRAERALEAYIAGKHAPPAGADRPADLLVDEVMTAYLKEHAAHSPSRAWICHTAAPILDWWSGKTLAEVTGPNCRAYLAWRCAQRVKRVKSEARLVSEQTARHELKTLRTAINFYHAEHGPLVSVPKVTLPARAAQREDYWLTRDEAAARIRAARARPDTAHVARLILIGLYSGTRPGAILKLGWLPSTTGGWFDLERGVLHRRGLGARRTRKRAPPARIHARLLPHLRRWQAADLASGIVAVVHYQDRAVAKLRRSWAGVARRAHLATRSKRTAGAGRAESAPARKDAPHILRHTAATWQMQAGTDLAEAAGYLGMTPDTLWSEYGHHHPDFQARAATVTPGRRGHRMATGTPVADGPARSFGGTR